MTASSATMTAQPTKPSSSPATVKMKSVDDRRDEAAAGERAVEQPLAVQAAGADRDLRLEAVVAGPGQVLRGVQERGQPGQLVPLQQVQLGDGVDAAGHGGEQAEHPVQPDAGDHDHAGQREDQHQHDAEGGLAFDQEDQRGGGERGQPRVPQPRPAGRVVTTGEQPRGGQDQAELGELRRLDLETAGHVDPGLRAVHRLADREHGQQEQQRQAVDDRRPASDAAVVRARGGHHQDEPERGPEDRLLQVGVRVEPGLPQRRLGRRPDQHRAERRERAGDGEQQPVPGPGHPAPGERPPEQGPPPGRERAGPGPGPAARREPDAHRCTFAFPVPGIGGSFPPGSAALWPSRP